MNNETRIGIERKIARALIRHMKAADWHVVAVFDGDCTSYPTSEKQVMDLVFNLDEASVRFIKGQPAALRFYGRRMKRADVEHGPKDGIAFTEEDNDWGGKDETLHGVLLVLGNCEDIITDWNYRDGDPDGFDAAMEAFDAYAVAGVE